jgi:hypothetical protein
MCAAVLAYLSRSPAVAADLYHSDALDVRWDNTLRYSAAFRVFPYDAALVGDLNYDDGDRNFAPGVVSDRLDMLSEIEASHDDMGLRISVAGWYDTVYHQRNANDSPATFNPISVPHDKFTRAVTRLHGGDIQLDDAFVYDNVTIAGAPVSFKLGRYALSWGESLFFGENSIAGGQAPRDLIKELELPSGYAKDVFLPVWQTSAAVQPAENVTLSAYYQLQWRKDQIPGAGSYFSYADFLDDGGERYILGPRRYLDRGSDIPGHDSGQFGVALQIGGDDFNYGFYALRFNSKEPEIYFRNYGLSDPLPLNGSYQLVYPNGIEVYGASVSSYLGDSTVAGEISVRSNMPLVSQFINVASGQLADGSDHPLYPIGDTLHGQVSSTTTFGGNSLWRRATLNVEFAANERLDISKNASAFDPSRDPFALSLQTTFAPQIFELLPALDVSLPIGFGYGLMGRSSVDSTQNAGAGNLELGVSATYRTVWQGSLNFTHFIGGPARQPFADRDFVSLSIQRAF